MFRKIVGTLLLIFLFFGCTTFKDAVKQYESYPPAKAMAGAYDNEFRWAAGYGYRGTSIEEVKKMALEKCEETRLARKVKSPCIIYYTQDLQPGAGPIAKDGEKETYRTFQDAVSDYESKPLHKVLVVAYDSAQKWSAGRMSGYISQRDMAAEDKARNLCEDGRTRQGLSSPCLLFALDDRFFFDKRNPTIATASEPRHTIQEKPAEPPTSIPTPSSTTPSEEKKTFGSGTGFSVREDGYILTCYHIIADADAIGVVVNGKVIPAILIKHSRNNDLAILKINKKTPHYLELAGESDFHIGEHVFTIGYPVIEVLGVEQKYTDGTISALSGIQDEASFMQISVPVQPGNSGGPLVNADGKVVGIITAKAADIPFFKTAGSLPQNINWAVKADMAKPLFKKPPLKKQKKSDRRLIIENTQKAVYMVVMTKSK